MAGVMVLNRAKEILTAASACPARSFGAHDNVRRCLNQTFFHHFYVDEEGVGGNPHSMTSGGRLDFDPQVTLPSSTPHTKPNEASAMRKPRNV